MIRMIQEKIYGNMATVYHRTSVSDLVNQVYTTGFRPGYGDMYGKGFYSTYELASQDRDDMIHYGNIVVKFAVAIENFFIFDHEEFKKSPHWKPFLQWCKKMNTYDPNKMPTNVDPDLWYTTLVYQKKYFNLDELLGSFSHVDRTGSQPKFTSDVALDFVKNDRDFMKKCDGIIFTGRRDGHVLVSYNNRLIYPISYREDGDTEFKSVERNIDYLKKWTQIKMGAEGEPLIKFPEGIAYFISHHYSQILKFFKTHQFDSKQSEFIKGIFDHMFQHTFDWSDLPELWIEDKVENKIRQVVYDWQIENLADSVGYAYGYDHPEDVLDEEPDDEDEEGNPIYSEEQKQEAALQAEQAEMEENAREVVNDLMGNPLNVRDYNFDNMEEIFEDFDNMDKNKILTAWLEQVAGNDYENIFEELESLEYDQFEEAEIVNFFLGYVKDKI